MNTTASAMWPQQCHIHKYVERLDRGPSRGPTLLSAHNDTSQAFVNFSPRGLDAIFQSPQHRYTFRQTYTLQRKKRRGRGREGGGEEGKRGKGEGRKERGGEEGSERRDSKGTWCQWSLLYCVSTSLTLNTLPQLL